MSHLSNHDYDCNFIWNENVFYDLGLDQVWCINGNWIPDEERYHIDEIQQWIGIRTVISTISHGPILNCCPTGPLKKWINITVVNTIYY
jgi:hypothetical protein